MKKYFISFIFICVVIISFIYRSHTEMKDDHAHFNEVKLIVTAPAPDHQHELWVQFLKKDSTTSKGHILVDLMTKAYDEEPDRHNVITVDQVRTVYWGGKLDQTQIDYFQVEWLDEQTVDIAGHVINPFKEKIDHYRE